jgi:hypothetical protein
MPFFGVLFWLWLFPLRIRYLCRKVIKGHKFLINTFGFIVRIHYWKSFAVRSRDCSLHCERFQDPFPNSSV